MTVFAPLSVGELLDKITILRIKKDKLPSGERRDNVALELELLQQIWERENIRDAEIAALFDELWEINRRLWAIEDSIRLHEKAGDFGDEFIQLARSVYVTNDHRSEIKSAINRLARSRIVEEKEYARYDDRSV
ncbi:MAG: DUF6165 family protein [Desulfobulbaceae bacterium]|jgi:hypothetical protein|nr:DUF6165 family protein [Desulfobulbaceae bacterium]